MKQAIGTTQVMKFVITFIIITFCFILATVLYLKAFKMNSLISGSLEKCEGRNDCSDKDMRRKLGAIGYANDRNWSCPSGYDKIGNFKACTRYKTSSDNFYRYDVVTYIEFGPLLGIRFSIPIRTETEKIYDFEK